MLRTEVGQSAMAAEKQEIDIFQNDTSMRQGAPDARD
jgi:hypothetical protein